MKAFVIKEANSTELKDIPVPEIKADEVLIKMKASGICRSDYDLIEGQYVLPVDYPVIPGHEWVGEIVETGSEVSSYKLGDRVTGECVIGCEECSICQAGEFTYCPNAEHFGFTLNGGHAEYIKAKPEWLHRVPDYFDNLLASLIEPFSIGYNAVYRIGLVDASDLVVIIGGGTIGLCALAVAKTMGAKVVLLDPIEFKRNVAITLGADYAINPLEKDPLQIVTEFTNGFGADVIIEASGNQNAIGNSLDLAKNGGRIALVGINLKSDINVKLGKIQSKGLLVKGMVGSPYIWEKVIAFLSNSKLDLSPISTHQFPLEKAEEAFSFTGDYNNNFIKVTLTNS